MSNASPSETVRKISTNDIPSDTVRRTSSEEPSYSMDNTPNEDITDSTAVKKRSNSPLANVPQLSALQHEANEVYDELGRPKQSYRPYTEASWELLLIKEEIQRKRAQNKHLLHMEGKLVDGEIQFDDDEDDDMSHDERLEEGNPLSEDILGEFPNDWLGIPLEEIDPYIKDKTFVVISKRFFTKCIVRMSATNSFFFLSPINPIHRAAIYLSTNQFFDYFIMLTILANCVTLAMNRDFEQAEYTFLAVYTAELIIRWISKGVIVSPYTSLRDPWNWLDVIVVSLSYIMIIVQSLGSKSVNINSLRTFRVFRILKTITIIPGLKSIISALLRSLRMLIDVIILTIFFMSLLGLISLQLYMGSLRRKCVKVPDWYSFITPVYDNVTAMNSFYNAWIKDTGNWYVDSGSNTYPICGNETGSGLCSNFDKSYVCLNDLGDNPNFGLTSFDNFGWVLMSMFQTITLDNWEDLYNKVIRANGSWNILFFICTTFFGAFYLINLMLAVVALSYEEQMAHDEKMNAKMKSKNKRKNYFFDPNKLKMKVKKTKKIKDKPDGENQSSDEENNANQAGGSQKGQESTAEGPHKSDDKSKPVTQQETKMKEDQTLTTDSEKKKAPVIRSSTKDTFDSSSSSQQRTMSETDPTSQDDDTTGYGTDNENESSIKENGASSNSMSSVTEETDISHYERRNFPRCDVLCHTRADYINFLTVQNYVYAFCTDAFFDVFLMLVIIMNTLVMAMDYYPATSTYSDNLDTCNKLFTAIFIAEAAIKLFAMPKLYWYNPWNIFDLFVVILSIIDLAVDNIKGLSVFRAFRLFRVFKLAQAWTAMRILLMIVFSAVTAVANLSLVLVIVVYIFAVIGMQLFSGTYTSDAFGGDTLPRWNFNDFLHAMMSTFRILCGEWVEAGRDCMRANGAICMVVFIPMTLLGRFMVLNLFLALLLNAFGSDQMKKKGGEDEDTKLIEAYRRVVRFFERMRCTAKVEQGPEDVQIVPTEPAVQIEQADVPSALSPHGSVTKERRMSRQSNASRASMKRERRLSHQSNRSRANSLMSTRNEEFHSFLDVIRINPPKENSSDEEDSDDDNDEVGRREAIVSNGSILNKGVTFNYDTKHESGDVATPLHSKKPPVHFEDIEEEETESTFHGKSRAFSRTVSGGSQVESDGEFILRSCCCHFCTRPCEVGGKCAFCSCCLCNPSEAYARRWIDFRLFIGQVTTHKAFEYFILLIIMVSSITLCFEDIYLDDKPTLSKALEYLGIIFAIIFTIEMLLKWIGMGFKEYFTSFWTILDCLIVTVAWIDIILNYAFANQANVGFLKALRTLRALRPLRSISRWEGMKIVVNSLISAIPSILNVILVGLMFWLIFSIMGVQFFKGKFYRCVNSTTGERLDAQIIPNKTICNQTDGTQWKNAKVNYDHVGAGFLALYQVATFEGWIELMQNSVDTTDVDQQPILEYSPAYYLYYVCFVVVGSFFILNLIISVMVDNFNALKEKYEGDYLDALMTPTQKHYYMLLKKLGSKKPQRSIKRPENEFIGFFYDISNSTKFEMAIVLVIFLNMISMMLQYYKQTRSIAVSLDVMNVIFTTIFVLEAVIKLIGLRWHYFRQAWNVFDFLVVILSVLSIGLGDLMDAVFISPTLLRVIRVFRIGRVLRLFKAAKGVRQLLFALLISLPALFNIGVLLFLIIFIYAIIGMSLFGTVKANNALDDVMNFETFGNAMLLLFRLSTAAGWNDILDSLWLEPPDCNPINMTKYGVTKTVFNGDCSFPWLAIVYMVSYVFITSMLVVNLYIAIILQNFSQAHEQEEIGVTEDDYDTFYTNWQRYDPHATQYIKYEQLSDFVSELDEPLCILKPNMVALISFDLPIFEGERIHCLDILRALVRHVVGDIEMSEDLEAQANEQINKTYDKAFPIRARASPISTTIRRKKEDIASKTLQRAWRSHKAQRALRNAANSGKVLFDFQFKAAGPGAQTFGSQLSLQAAKWKVERTRKKSILKITPPSHFIKTKFFDFI